MGTPSFGWISTSVLCPDDVLKVKPKAWKSKHVPVSQIHSTYYGFKVSTIESWMYHFYGQEMIKRELTDINEVVPLNTTAIQ